MSYKASILSIDQDMIVEEGESLFRMEGRVIENRGLPMTRWSKVICWSIMNTYYVSSLKKYSNGAPTSSVIPILHSARIMKPNAKFP